MPNLTPSRRTVAEVALQVADGYAAARIHEVGGNNRGDEVEFFLRLVGLAPGNPWCAAFVSACLVKAYARLRGVPEDRAMLMGGVAATSAAMIPLSGSCIELADGARERGILHTPAFIPSRGDLVLFDWKGIGEPHHVGLVRSGDGHQLLTVEGNTDSGSDGSQADGGGVYLRTRPVADVYGYVHW